MGAYVYNSETKELEPVAGYQQPVDKVEDGNLNAVTSNAVNDALTNFFKYKNKSITLPYTVEDNCILTVLVSSVLKLSSIYLKSSIRGDFFRLTVPAIDGRFVSSSVPLIKGETISVAYNDCAFPVSFKI